MTSELSSNEDEMNSDLRKQKIIKNDQSSKTNTVVSQLSNPPLFEESEPD